MRTPGKHKQYERVTVELVDGQKRKVRTGLVKSLWKTAGRSMDGKRVSLKEFARSVPEGEVWFHNKKVNTSNPPLGLGRTRKRKTGQKK